VQRAVPVWVGEDPDLGDCRGLLSFHVDTGRIRGLDVSDLTVVLAAYIPGNVLAGNWEVVVLIDEARPPSSVTPSWPPSAGSSAGRSRTGPA